jgi:hypothetical protein
VSLEFDMGDMLDEFAALGVEVKRNPPYMMLGGVRMRYFFTQSDLDLKQLIGFDFCRALNYRDMFFGFPIRTLNVLAYFCHHNTSICL